MKCWECKNQVSEAHVVRYYSEFEEKEASRNVCKSCYPLLQFDPCHYVRVNKITQRSLNLKKSI